MPQSPIQNTPVGVLYNVLASALFALMCAYAFLLQPLTGLEIYGWRILLTVPCLTVLVWVTGRRHEISLLLRRLRAERYFWLHRLLSAFLLGVQLWLFMWAPVNGYGLDVSLGYFLLPIVMVIVGRFAFSDRLSRFQALACLLAVVGIACQLLVTQRLSWPAMLVCLGYPGYFWMRRHTDTNTLGSTWLDMCLSLPFSLYFVVNQGRWLPVDAPASLPWLIVGLGVISALALGFQALSAPRLNLTVFGLLIYVEPTLLVVVALLAGETIAATQWPTFIAIWLAVVVLVLEGVWTVYRGHRQRHLACAAS